MNRKQRRAGAKLSSTPIAASSDSYFKLGVALRQQGKIDQAVEAYRQSVAINPAYAEAHYNLGNALFGQNKLEEAVTAYRDAIRGKPDHAGAYCNLGIALKGLNKLDEAVAAYLNAVKIRPDHAEAHSNLGNVLQIQGKFDESVAAYRQAIAIKPDNAEALFNLGNALLANGEFELAVPAYRRAAALKPGHAETHYNLGNALKKLGKNADATAAFLAAIDIRPDYTEAYSNLGNALVDVGQLDEAISVYRQAIGISPDAPEVHYNLGNALKDRASLEDAATSYRRAIELRPTYAEAFGNLGIVLMAQGKLDQAVAAYSTAIDIKPDFAEVYSNLLFSLNYREQETQSELFALHRRWNDRFGRLPNSFFQNECDPARRLRIGYVSPDFREHSVAYYFEPLLSAHNRQTVEIFCYADVLRPDAVTARLQSLAEHWRPAAGLSDDELTNCIEADRIDILVDLAGHTAHNRLQIFARKPAPIQVTWLGYPNTTGLQSIDYRFVDKVTDPPGQADEWSSEKLLRLEGCFLCYGAPADAPKLVAPPCLDSGPVTFGSFNNPAKISLAVCDTWAKLLTCLPDARLLLKGKPFADPATRDLFTSRMAERGVEPERLELVAWVAGRAAHLELYNRIDIALDPFPYNGTTTTCEALWMGVPAVTLCGNRHAGRVGASLLHQIGQTECVANSTEGYVEIAIALAADRPRLRELRSSLRVQMFASPLCDGTTFARKIEGAFREMWKKWCGT
jgi:predicted O-linked N-acetylglucosamine transferase (SPINDLY family)